METTQTQEKSPMIAEPQKEHQWLQKLVGEWTMEGESVMEPGKPPEKFKGTERVRPVGDLWILAWGQGDMPGGGSATTLLTLGYDPEKGRYVGTWIGSMMTYLWVYYGELDAAEKVLTLHTEGPSMAGDGTMSEYRETIEFKSDDHRVWTSSVLSDDGKWHQFGTMDFRRRK